MGVTGAKASGSSCQVQPLTALELSSLPLGHRQETGHVASLSAMLTAAVLRWTHE